jgi:NAD(P)H-dependent flavin oxidoreductase YrpB (nitropropane dioxygenase family)
MIIAILDYGTRTLRIATVFHATGEAETDIAAIRAYYKGAVGLHRDKFAIDG